MRTTSLWLTASAVAGLLTVASPASAGLVEVDVFNNVVYTQSTASAPTTPDFYFFNVSGQTENAGDFDSVSVTYPGPDSPESLPISGKNFGNGPAFATEADLHAAYPFGDYDISAHNSVTNATQDAVVHYTADHFTSDIPALSGATFNALNGLNPEAALQIIFNSFTPAAGSDEGDVFFSISDASGTVFSQGFLSPSSTSIELPGGTLDPNTQYSFQLDFSDRINGLDDVNRVPVFQGFDVRTVGSFTTGDAVAPAPEPATLSLLASALLGMGAIRRRGKPA